MYPLKVLPTQHWLRKLLWKSCKPLPLKLLRQSLSFQSPNLHAYMSKYTRNPSYRFRLTVAVQVVSTFVVNSKITRQPLAKCSQHFSPSTKISRVLAGQGHLVSISFQATHQECDPPVQTSLH